MASYRRFVSYIYRYEGEEKGKNVGFARVECRGNHEKISLWIKEGCLEAELTLESAFLFRKDGQTVKVPVGEFPLEWGNGAYQYEGQELQDGFLPEDACGMIFTGREVPERVFAMVWDDKDLVPGLVISSEELRQETPRESPKMVWDTEWAQVIADMEETTPEMIWREDSSEEEQRIEDPLEKNFSEMRPKGEFPEEMFSEPFPEEARQEEREDFSEQSGQEEQAVVSKMVLDNTPEPALVWEERQERMPIPAVGPEDSMEESWYFLSKRYVKVNPLAPEYEAECLKIRPGDIGRLPRAYWIFCNNSFLLKGYYQFQHLMLARFPGKERPVYYLCVPGRYYGNDKFTAEMFGFDRFFPSNKGWRKDPQISSGGRLQPGTFGYWCAEVETEHDTGRTLHERSFKTSEKSI